MSRQLQILLDEDEHTKIQRIARRQRVTVTEWVREALRKAVIEHRNTVAAKLRAIDDASLHRFPTADIDAMLREIDAGRDPA